MAKGNLNQTLSGQGMSTAALNVFSKKTGRATFATEEERARFRALQRLADAIENRPSPGREESIT